MGTAERLLGVWNLDVYPLSLGGVLFFVEELEMRRLMCGADRFDLAVTGGGVTAEKFRFLQGVLTAFQNTGECYWGVTAEDLLRLQKTGGYSLWPSVSDQRSDPRRAMFAQAFYREHGFIPSLEVKLDLREWAERWMASTGFRCVVPVHLKNNPREVRCSNARQEVWARFFKEAIRWDACFILVGDDFVHADILALPNVVRARAIGSDLARDMALIRSGSFFMGMSSGPCNMAILGKRPYVIFKNPDHDVREMNEELGTAEKFPFAVPGQKFFRKDETVEDLLNCFKEFYGA